jgi:C1A family cysteine protease
VAIVAVLCGLGLAALSSAIQFGDDLKTKSDDAIAASKKNEQLQLYQNGAHLSKLASRVSAGRYKGPHHTRPHRHHHSKYQVPLQLQGGLAASVDLRPKMPPIYDQGDIGSCVDNALAGILQYDGMRENGGDRNTPSRLFLYYNARTLENDVNQDAGSTVEDGILGAAKWGYCDETLWPYLDSNEFTKPSQSCYDAALPFAIRDYHTVTQSASSIKGTLAGGNPVIFGFQVYQSFMSTTVARTGIVPMPKRSEQILGGHSVLLVGYSEASQRYLCRNSWGTGWGLAGYFWMPYQYVHSPVLSGDFWVVNTVPTGSGVTGR